LRGNRPQSDLSVDLNRLSSSSLAEMAAAIRILVACRHDLTVAGRTIADEVAGGAPDDFTHYPPGDVYDAETHSQYYFHLHRIGDYGHFHTFLRAGGMPAGVIPDDRYYGLGQSEREPVSHLIAIALDRRGEPGELFTTNRWVTAETWYKADDVIAMLPRFRIGHDHPTSTANRWVEAVMTVFRPQIVALLAARDRCIEQHPPTATGNSVLESRSLEVTSRLVVDIDDQIARIEHALASRV